MSIVDDVQDVSSPRPRWMDWVEKNSQPKNYYFPRPKRESTRWQKRGPMTRRDWVRFYHWAAKNAIPRELPIDEPPADPAATKKKKKKQKTLAQLLDRIMKLCMPRKRHAREKYHFPPKPQYAYSPKIFAKRPPHRDPGRPVIVPKVPKTFQHIELETDFWTNYRFPIMRGALKYKPSANMLKLAQPRILPPLNPHCPIPEKPVETIPSRHKMTYRQWLGHQRRLEYLAKPVMRPQYDYEL